MPKLPASHRNSYGEITSKKHAAAVVRTVTGHSRGSCDRNRFMTVLRQYFIYEPSAKEKFMTWYEAL